jgi:hypothetical protein
MYSILEPFSFLGVGAQIGILFMLLEFEIAQVLRVNRVMVHLGFCYELFRGLFDSMVLRKVYRGSNYVST